LAAGFVAVVAPAGAAVFLWCVRCFFADFDVVDFCVLWVLGAAFGAAGLVGAVEPDWANASELDRSAILQNVVSCLIMSSSCLVSMQIRCRAESQVASS
jgi:hypothetical protein